MKLLTILFLYLVLSVTAFAQKTVKGKLIISDSLYNAPSDEYSFVSKGNSLNINDILIIKNDSLTFSITYTGGCEIPELKLVTDGVLQKDGEGNQYYLLKLYVFNKDHCRALVNRNLSFNLSDFKKPGEVVYFQFHGYDALIMYK